MATTRVLTVGGHAKVVDLAENIFSQDIGNATYIAYSSNRNVVGFQINGSVGRHDARRTARACRH